MFGQKTIVDDKGIEWYIPDVLPKYPGGSGAFEKYVYKSLKRLKCAKKEQKEGAHGDMKIIFVLEATGYVRKGSVEFRRMVFSDECASEITRFIEASPKWDPPMVSELNLKVPMPIIQPVTIF